MHNVRGKREHKKIHFPGKKIKIPTNHEFLVKNLSIFQNVGNPQIKEFFPTVGNFFLIFAFVQLREIRQRIRVHIRVNTSIYPKNNNNTI